jgi:hypothetical protein
MHLAKLVDCVVLAVQSWSGSTNLANTMAVRYEIDNCLEYHTSESMNGAFSGVLWRID